MSASQGRAVLLVLDSVGVGALPDAADFGDEGSDTLGNIARAVDGFDLPSLRALGLGNIEGVEALSPVDSPTASYGRMAEVSIGKDTATGHWEFMGCILDEPFQTFPEGFPADLIQAFIEATGCKEILGNVAASGTVIIEELGQEHQRTGYPIVYTSADPVFQIAAHEDVVPLQTLYQWCQVAYELVVPRGLSRVIARPFVGQWPDFERTANRKDFTFPPPKPTALDALTRHGVEVTGIGKIASIYAHQGVDHEILTKDNEDGIDRTLDAIKSREGLIFTNLVDFDAKYGHRRNVQGYAEALMAFDDRLCEFINALSDGDLFLITADHGNDPTFRGTDHTREYVPVLAMIKGVDGGVNLGTRESFADVGATIADFFGVQWDIGQSFLSLLLEPRS